MGIDFSELPVAPGAPAENLKIYDLLFAIEGLLRELIIDTLGSAFGPFWYRTRLAPEARDHFREGVERDRTTGWTFNIPHHPVYYLTLPDLRTTIVARDNWSTAFNNVFSKNKELITTDLVELEFIRNKVAHNRRASLTDLTVTRAAYDKLYQQIGPARSKILAARYTAQTGLSGGITALRREADISLALASQGRRIRNLRRWRQACDEWWWFDQDYLGWSLQRIIRYFAKIDEYNAATAATTAQEAKRWPAEHALAEDHQGARSDLSSILEKWKEG